MRQYGVRVHLHRAVKELFVENGRIGGVVLCREEGYDHKAGQDKQREYADAVIIATGGLSYPVTGSTGDGYRLAKSVGHSIGETLPALVPMNAREDWVKELQGLSLRNVRVTL